MEKLLEKVTILCQELGIDVPAPNSSGAYEIHCDNLSVTISKGTRDKHHLLILGNLGPVTKWIEESSGSSFVAFLTQMITLHSARVKKLGIHQILSLEADDIILWENLDLEGSIPEFMASCEAMFNELEFWHQKYSSALV